MDDAEIVAGVLAHTKEIPVAPTGPTPAAGWKVRRSLYVQRWWVGVVLRVFHGHGLAKFEFEIRLGFPRPRKGASALYTATEDVEGGSSSRGSSESQSARPNGGRAGCRVPPPASTAGTPAVAWLCKRHSDGDRIVPQGEECPACGATEPLSVFDRVRDSTQR